MFYPQFLERSFCLFVSQILFSLLELSVCRFVCHVFSSLSWVDFRCFSFALCISDPLSVCLLCFIPSFLSGVSVCLSVKFYPHFLSWVSVVLSVMFFPHFLEWIFSVFHLPFVSVTLCLFVCYVCLFFCQILSSLSWAECLFFPVTFYPHLKVRFEVCSTIYDRRCLPVC